ncbi:amino acid adenylation domain-containing protein [Streptomyces boncukensis]|uniref:Amino acid adenylation domain-containing protein n=1 Tax=Streptomyces boncukensis TaxID=2711219 RepID=A0A6G4X4Q2_9ACTN|nr:amino acid adenylation domain-containing protein [Streptomyces boncukensis]NGO71714.1 amino acid adenylation domain-containing protein [Streptomyces boncukensis]
MTETAVRKTAVPDDALSVLRGAAPATPHGPRTLLDRYARQVREHPGAPAVEDGDLTWTYAELDALAARTADALRGRIRAGEIAAVCLDRSAALVATAVALARLGAVYLPLGLRPGERRLAAVTERLGVRCLIGDPALLPAGTGEPLPLPLPDAGANAAPRVAAVLRETPAAPAAPAVPEGTHYAVLTSGSTGEPKAVAVGGGSLAALAEWYGSLVGLGPGARHSLLVGVSFDPHLKELWAALTTGAALSVPPEAVRWDPDALTGWWRGARVTAAVLPTPLAELVLARPWPDLPDLRHLCIGGDRLRRWPGPDVTARVHNAYGPAEATVMTTLHTLDPAAADAGGPPPIGTPVDGALVCVTDGAGRPVPRGEPGELRIGGGPLALGYLDAELTARRFVPPPPGVPGTGRVYRTGDRVRMRADGVLEFLGRLDGQVKISGVRVEPAEVEAAFERDPRVSRAVVAARDTPAGTALAAFVEAAPGAPCEPAELLRGVRGWLPEQAVPQTVRYVEEFPLDANGKVDRAALPTAAPPPPQGSADDGDTDTERLVVRVCRELLAQPGLSPGDGFLESGGTSLLAARLLAALDEQCGVRLRAPEALRQPDLRALAALVDDRTAAERGGAE